MQRFEFQSKAQDELVARAATLLSRNDRCVITLKAPTGSGKTVMMANALAALVKACEGKQNLAILWVAPNQLHEQSHERLKQVYGESKALSCLTADELMGTDIPDRSVVFMNWGSIDSETLLLRRDNESRRNLESFVQRARLAGRKVVLVVDESHLHLDSGAQAQVVVDHIIRPDLLIEVSATPRAERPDAPVVVLREDVVAAGLIRKGITVNPGTVPTATDEGFRPVLDGTSESLLDAALEKQAELTRQFKAAGSSVVPLVLVQLPDRRADADALKYFENYLLMQHGLERGNGVAVWLSGDRSPEIDAIADFGSNVRVMFFKQAAATGWDCPRAQILVGLREMQSDTFTAQVLGRIVRQPEHSHYENDDLNRGYVFTNYPKLEIDAETATWLDKAWVRAAEPFTLDLPNWTAKNTDRRGFLPLSVVGSIIAHRSELEGVAHQGAVTTLLLDGDGITGIDEKRVIEGSRAVALDLHGLQENLDGLKADLVSATASQTKGKKYVEKALRDVAAELADSEDEKTVLETILHPLNEFKFRAMARLGIEDFLAAQQRAEREFEARDSWEAPQSRFLELSAPLGGYGKCLYAPVLAGQFGKSNVEEPFTRLIDLDPLVAVWLKNGDNGKEHFALRYRVLDPQTRLPTDEYALFYPDFIVRLAGGGVRLFDTKGAGDSEHSTGNDAKTLAKAHALAAYCEEQRRAGWDVGGGIVVFKHDLWWVHSGENYAGAWEVSAAAGWCPFSI